jgi:hypothetical protein
MLLHLLLCFQVVQNLQHQRAHIPWGILTRLDCCGVMAMLLLLLLLLLLVLLLLLSVMELYSYILNMTDQKI